MAVTIRSRLEAAAKKLREHDQEHLLRFAAALDQAGKTRLLEDIDDLDLELVARLKRDFIDQEPSVELPEEIIPPQVYPARPGADLQTRYQRARERGECLIAEHKVAAFTVAGGQGTRLNFDGPKGDVPATPLRNKSLFRLFAEGILAVQRRYNCVVPWYIMTSQANHADTVASFRRNEYFGLDPKNVMLFPQGMMPCLDLQGRILLAERDQVAKSPDGHGGSLRALYKSGAIEDMARRGVEYISYFQVDNPLVYVVDPLFIGLHAQDNAEMSSKAVRKAGPFEKVGNFAVVNERVHVIEYSDLPDELAEKRDENGELLFEFGSIAIHIINRDFVKRLNEHGFSLPWHRAVKKVPHVDDQGRHVEPDAANGVKFETFVFDGLPLATKSIILEIERDEQFAPIKNATGVDSLQTSQELQIGRAVKWLEEAGVSVPRKPDGTPDLLIEISPLFALDPHEVSHKKSQLRPLRPGDIVYLS